MWLQVPLFFSWKYLNVLVLSQGVQELLCSWFILKSFSKLWLHRCNGLLFRKQMTINTLTWTIGFRLHILHDTNRDSNRSSDSWINLGSKVAAMAVRCMETVVSKYEDQVRSERERRNENTWDFCSYFLFQVCCLLNLCTANMNDFNLKAVLFLIKINKFALFLVPKYV